MSDVEEASFAPAHKHTTARLRAVSRSVLRVRVASAPPALPLPGTMEREAARAAEQKQAKAAGAHPEAGGAEAVKIDKDIYGSFASRLMEKMGFKDGEGLGARGDGIRAPLVASKRPRNLGLG